MKKILLYSLAVMLFNTAIAGLLAVIDERDGFALDFVFSQCIGLSCYALNSLAMYRITGKFLRLAVLSLTLPGSVAMGLTLAFFVTGVGSWYDPRAWQSVVIGLFFGVIASIAFFLAERIRVLDAEVKQRRMNEVESEKRQIEAHLKLLQAQIEPHFLFNTLANVASLIDTDTAQAKRLLERLNDWLRVALTRARSERATLADELALLENYLQILAMRFGERLRWRIEATEEARCAPFPPMLLQPLVENAVRHGIEPKLGGGTVRIQAAMDGMMLRVQVSDDGAGLGGEMRPGAGLDNVRARLKALYGEEGRMALETNTQGGATAMLEIPK